MMVLNRDTSESDQETYDLIATSLVFVGDHTDWIENHLCPDSIYSGVIMNCGYRGSYLTIINLTEDEQTYGLSEIRVFEY